MVDSHRPLNVFELLLPCILEGDIKLGSNETVTVAGDANAAGFGNAFEAYRHIYTITVNVTAVQDDVPNIDTNAKLDPLLVWHVSVTLGHSVLHIESTAHGVHDAAELGQQAITGVLDNSPTVFGDLRINQNAQMVLKPGVRPLLVHAG
jgi:hypothetical protein